MASLRLVLALTLAAGCSSGLRYQAVGTGRVVAAGAPTAVGPGGDPHAGLPATVALPPGLPHSTYDVRFEVWLARAAEVDWTLTCGSAMASGVVGEPFEAYRARRLVELRRQREEAQRQAAAVGAAVGELVLGQTTATVAAATPNASAEATATVDGAAVGAAVGASAVSTDVELAPGDVGAGLHRGRATVVVPDAEATTCALVVAPREPDLSATGQFHVARQDDRAQREAVAHAKIAVAARADLYAQLQHRIATARPAVIAVQVAAAPPPVAIDAALEARVDVEWAAEEARARALAEARAAAARAQAEAHRQIAQTRFELVATLERRGASRDYHARIAGVCRGTRARLRDELIADGADPELRLRLRLAATAERERRAAAAAAERARLEALAEARLELALAVRGRLVAQHVARGGAVRTAMPAPIDEMPGEPPMAGYAWEPGHWIWYGGQWRWQAGYWLGTNASAAVATSTPGPAAPVVVAPAVPAGVTIGVTVGVGVGVGAARPAPARPQTQDHRRR
jgi:hypothetical protein